MSIAIETPAADDFDELAEVDSRAFGANLKDFQTDAVRNGLDLDRFRVARDSDRAIVGVSGSFEMHLTLPGGNQIPISGVTWISVAASHRRRGILRSMIDALHQDAADRGEIVQALTSSEGSIYERFGYGIATWNRPVKIFPKLVSFDDPTPPAPGAIRILNAKNHAAEIADRWAAYAPTQVGEVTRTKTHIEMELAGVSGDVTLALHDDGFATWTVKGNWVDGHADFSLQLLDLAASTPAAYTDLWKTVLSVDLVNTITSVHTVGPEELLPSLLGDQRQLRTTAIFDGLWLRLSDVAAAFGQRSYRVNDSLVLEVDDQRGRVGSEGCTITNEPADLSMGRAAAGPLLLGGVSASRLAASGRLQARDSGVLGRADALLGWNPLAHCRTGF